MSGIFLNILLSINMFKYLLDHSHVLHLCKKQVFQLLHCGAVWPVYPTTKTEDTRKKMMNSKHGRMKTSITTAMKAPFWRQQKWCYQANPNIQIWIWTIQTQESGMLVISLELYKNHSWILLDIFTLVECLINRSNLRRVASDLSQSTMKPTVSHKL